MTESGKIWKFLRAALALMALCLVLCASLHHVSGHSSAEHGTSDVPGCEVCLGLRSLDSAPAAGAPTHFLTLGSFSYLPALAGELFSPYPHVFSARAPPATC